LAEAVYPNDTSQRQQWVERQCHDLRHGQEQQVLQRINALRGGRGAGAQTIAREKAYLFCFGNRV